MNVAIGQMPIKWKPTEDSKKRNARLVLHRGKKRKN
jgi:hypothetical protein